MSVNWITVRTRLRAAIKSINPYPVTIRRIATRGAFDSLTGSVGADTYTTFDVIAVPMTDKTRTAYFADRTRRFSDLGALVITETLDMIVAASSSYTIAVGDIAVLDDGDRVIAEVEPYRATFDTDLAYGCRFQER